jgi:hypothetical protein
MSEAEVKVSEVKALKTRSGNTRFVLVDDAGNEYSTFKETVAAEDIESGGAEDEEEPNGT